MVFHNFLSKVSDKCILRASISYQKSKGAFMLTSMISNLTKMTGKDKQSHIFRKSKSSEISSTGIYIGKDRKFIIYVFYWRRPWNIY